ncbi:MAG: DUF4910 domain-containing protein [Rhodospirillales bacterium]|nr:DUF4910 domain-containing protein [Rhodospirillales bacterium]
MRGDNMLGWAKDLFPICRSLAGPGVRETLTYLNKLLPEMTLHEVATGEQVFDWVVPQEWSVDEAYIEDEDGVRIVDFKDHNLHLVSYSEPVYEWMDLDTLDQHLYSLPDRPDAIPYVTAYYERLWGFCLSHKQRQSLKPGRYRAVVKSALYDGALSYGELLLKGREEKEILLSTYICHPSMANNELSGPVLTAALAQWIDETLSDRKYTYRIVFVPETIGAIAYLSRNLDQMKQRVVAGFVLTCVGDERCYSMIPSRTGGTRADQVLSSVLASRDDVITYSFLDRGSDERQYCSPGVDLPVAVFCRSKFGEYPEYHSSLDNFDLVTSTGLGQSFDVMADCITALEQNVYYRAITPCEPQLGRRGLYSNRGIGDIPQAALKMRHILAYADGTHDVLSLAEITGIGPDEVRDILRQLEVAGLVCAE